MIGYWRQGTVSSIPAMLQNSEDCGELIQKRATKYLEPQELTSIAAVLVRLY